ncbi:MAG: YfjP family GTPase, partial [Actinomycetota bacterium]|nr:YfjP family GTPase [Actinomycetota bacterium]
MSTGLTERLSLRRRGRELPERLEALREVVELGDGRLPAEPLAEARGVLARAGERLQLSGEHTVVALAGATGSGKSSLFNALTGQELSQVGVRRPTTSQAHAAVWGPNEAVGPLLAWLGASRWHAVDAVDGTGARELPGLVLLDLPDHDSTEQAHRLEVDRLVELVDLLVWVVDPQKYADAALHERYLRPLAGHGAVTVVVLNQVDRLDPAAAEQCLADLRRLLADDGLADARVLPVSARTGAGLPELTALLADAVRRREAFTDRLSADVTRVVGALAPRVGAEGGEIDDRERAHLVDA